MSFQISDGAGTPHATSHSDLLAKFKTFITGQGAVSIASAAGLEYFKLVGAGSDEIFFAIKLYESAPEGNYAWILQGLTGYGGSGLDFDNQPGAIQANPPALALWNNSIPYWFFYTSRRVICIAKVGSTYHAMHAGWVDRILGYPSQWPYPLLIGGSTYRDDSVLGANKPYKYSVVTNRVSNFMFPLVGADAPVGSMCLRVASGEYKRLLNAGGFGVTNSTGAYPYLETLSNNGGWLNRRPAPGGKHVTKAITLVEGGAQPNRWCELGSLRAVPGFGLASETELTEDGSGDIYIVFNNVFRTDGNSFFCIKKA